MGFFFWVVGGVGLEEEEEDGRLRRGGVGVGREDGSVVGGVRG